MSCNKSSKIEQIQFLLDIYNQGFASATATLTAIQEVIKETK